MQERITLTQNQQERLKRFRAQIEPLRAQIEALEQGAYAMLTTIIEIHGVPDGVTYNLSDDSSELVLKNGKPAPVPEPNGDGVKE